MYASSRRDWPLRTPEHIQAAYEGLFQRHSVDVYIAGHKHYYERTGRVFAGENDANGTVHMLAHGETSPAGLFKVGVHSVSADGLRWSAPRVAYTLAANWSRRVPADRRPVLGRREAPQVLLSNDGLRTPVALYNAAQGCSCHYGAADPACNWGDSCRSFSMVCRWA